MRTVEIELDVVDSFRAVRVAREQIRALTPVSGWDTSIEALERLLAGLHGQVMREPTRLLPLIDDLRLPAYLPSQRVGG